jgi:Reverse transcriptase (RNA-dependent DNA polymerase)
MLHDFPLINSPGQTLLYADDIAVILPSYSSSEAKSLLQDYLNSVADWCAEWKFSISASKCALLPFSRKRKPSTAPALRIDGQDIPVVKQFKFLGLIFYSKLSWSLHIQYVIKKCLKF